MKTQERQLPLLNDLLNPVNFAPQEARDGIKKTDGIEIPRRLKQWTPCPYSTPKRRHTIVEKDGRFICCSCDHVWTLMGEPLGKIPGIGCFPPDLNLNQPFDLRELLAR